MIDDFDEPETITTVEDPKARQPRKMLNLDDVLSIVPVGRTTLFRMVRDGLFPKPTYISNNRRVWYADQLVAWQDRVDCFQPGRRRGRGRPSRKADASAA